MFAYKTTLDGVVMAADTLGSYGSSCMFKSVQRIVPVGEYVSTGLMQGGVSSLCVFAWTGIRFWGAVASTRTFSL